MSEKEQEKPKPVKNLKRVEDTMNEPPTHSEGAQYYVLNDELSNQSAEYFVYESTTGPWPLPEILEKYDKILPGFAEEMQREIQKESRARRKNDRWQIRAPHISRFLGQFFALFIAAFGLYIAWDLAKSGNTVVAGVIATIDLVGLASIFIYSTKKTAEIHTTLNDGE